MILSNLIPPQYKALAIGIAVVVVIAGAFGAGWTAQGWRKNAEIAELQAQRSNEIAGQLQSALDDFDKASKTINAAATQYAGIQTTLGTKLDQLRKDFKNAKPLPVDCRPDDSRVRNLNAAIDAANQAAIGR